MVTGKQSKNHPDVRRRHLRESLCRQLAAERLIRSWRTQK